MQIGVKLGEPLWRAAGQRRLSLTWADGATVTVVDVLVRLAAEYPEFARAYAGAGLVRAYPYRVFVDAQVAPSPHLGQEGEARPMDEPRQAAALQAGQAVSPVLRDGQTVFILLPAAGG